MTVENLTSEEVNLEHVSNMSDICSVLGVRTPKELDTLFTELDQSEMKKGSYDYEDENLLLNKIKKHLETFDPETLNEEELKWRNEMLWLWNHHAAGMALLGHKDHETARNFAEEALSYMPEDHPNKITKLLYFLSCGDVTGAENWIQNEVSDSEKNAVLDAIQNYKEHVLK